MRLPSPPRRALRLVVTLAAFCGAVAASVAAGCGPDESVIWICLNPTTGKEDGSIYDANHYVNGVFDPCHCYDPCGPEKSCPIVVDAGPPPPGCDEDGGDGGDGGP